MWAASRASHRAAKVESIEGQVGVGRPRRTWGRLGLNSGPLWGRLVGSTCGVNEASKWVALGSTRRASTEGQLGVGSGTGAGRTRVDVGSLLWGSTCGHFGVELGAKRGQSGTESPCSRWQAIRNTPRRALVVVIASLCGGRGGHTRDLHSGGHARDLDGGGHHARHLHGLALPLRRHEQHGRPHQRRRGPHAEQRRGEPDGRQQAQPSRARSGRLAGPPPPASTIGLPGPERACAAVARARARAAPRSGGRAIRRTWAGGRRSWRAGGAHGRAALSAQCAARARAGGARGRAAGGRRKAAYVCGMRWAGGARHHGLSGARRHARARLGGAHGVGARRSARGAGAGARCAARVAMGRAAWSRVAPARVAPARAWRLRVRTVTMYQPLLLKSVQPPDAALSGHPLISRPD